MNSNVSDINNLKKVPRGLKISGEAANNILKQKELIDKKKHLTECDKKYIDVYYSLIESGITIKE